MSQNTNSQPQYSIIREQAGVPVRDLNKQENERVNRESQKSPKTNK